MQNLISEWDTNSNTCCHISWSHYHSLWRFKQNDQHFADNILNTISLNKIFLFCLKILWSFYFGVQRTISIGSVLPFGTRPATNHNLHQGWPSSVRHICVTRVWGVEHFKNMYSLFNLRNLKISVLYKDILCGISKEPFEIPHKIPYPYIERYYFIQYSNFKSSSI